MGVTMHVKSDSEVTSIDASSPPRSPRRPLYYVQSPSPQDLEKMSYGSSPFGSPPHYHCSPIHHSRESSTSRFSASLKTARNPAAWKRIHRRSDDDDIDEEEEEEEDDDGGDRREEHMKFYVVCFVFLFVVLFTIFALILWAASIPYEPKIAVENMVFRNFNLQAGMDRTGVSTDMLTLNSTVRIFYRNPATFFGVHVTSTPVELHYYNLKIASGHIKKFYQPRKSERTVVAVVDGNQVPLYGSVPVLDSTGDRLAGVAVPLNLTFMVRSRAYVLGRLVKPKFYRNVRCEVTLQGKHLGKLVNSIHSCFYD